MKTHDKSEGGLTLMEAVDALSTIAETHWEQEAPPIAVSEEEEVNWKEAKWLYGSDKEKVVKTVKDIFKVILNHLRHYYQTDSTIVTDSNTLEGIKTLMVLVGEAAKKLDRYTDLFKQRNLHSVSELREYKLLQDFYRRKISRTIDEALLGKWILALTQRTLREHQLKVQEKKLSSLHVFVDLDSVKKDTEYELFFIRKEDGTRFFSPRLIRNIKLVCDFGYNIGQEKEKDPLADQPIWDDRYARSFAEKVLKQAKPIINKHYAQIASHKDQEWIACVNKAIVALLLASSNNRLIGSGSSKGCGQYLTDFQKYLREAMDHREFQQIVAYEPEGRKPLQEAVVKIVYALISGVFTVGTGSDAVKSFITFLLNECTESASPDHKKEFLKHKNVWSKLASDYVIMQKFLKRHPNGPLNKMLMLLEEGDYQNYDPYIQQILPEHLYNLYEDHRKISVFRTSSPTSQEFIHKANVIEEFHNFLRSAMDRHQKVLLVNFQDRTSWREHARANVLEDLQEGTEFSEMLTVITLPKDTEFYEQLPPYSEDHQLHLFKDHFKEHLLDNLAGFYFPEALLKEMDENWIDGVFEAISKVFYSSKNVLSKDTRLDFIELFYLFIELKALEVSQADSLYFTCKDGVDISSAAAIELYIFQKLMHEEALSEEDYLKIAEMLYMPALHYRERVMLPERQQRMIGVIKAIENVREENGHAHFVKMMKENFGKFFHSPIISAKIAAVETSKR